MMDFIKNNILFLAGIFFVLFFFHKFFVFGLLPIPTDNIVGLYHPYRDFYSKDYPNGIPFENVQIADPVRQQYLWRELAITQMKKGVLPLWNPYNFTGYPLLANFQTAAFYPLNILMLIIPFEYAWTFLIISQPLFAFMFMFFYLRNLYLSNLAAFVSSIAFGFSGFFISWLEWGNIASTGLWLPLILLSIDKILDKTNNKKLWKINKWSVILLFALATSFFAGHLQTFFYMFVLSFSYLLYRLLTNKGNYRLIINFAIYGLIFILLTAVQWIPTMQLVSLSGRSVDQVSSAIEGWFIPWQNLIQFIAPDFFGNPATLNYWGVWNYGEFIGYIGILPLIFSIGAIIFIRKKIILFYGLFLFLGIIFAYPSIISNIPFKLDIPFISTSQPTRLLYIVNFSLVVLAGFGFDYYSKNKLKIIFPLIIAGGIFALLWGYVKFNNLFPQYLMTTTENIAVSYSNLRLPTLIFVLTFLLFITEIIINKKLKNKKLSHVVVSFVILIFLFDIFRFADKYTVFSKKEYLYPKTESISFLQSRENKFRIMANDSRILPPNFTAAYGIQSVDGYDPLYLLRYAELAAAIGRNEPNINPPFGFNRIITPQNYHENIVNIFNVGYVLSLSDIEDLRFEKVFEENETKVYRNNSFIPRAFFVEQTIGARNKYDAIADIFENQNNLNTIAVVEGDNYIDFNKNWGTGSAKISQYSENAVEINVNIDDDGFLVLLDSYYPTWRVKIDGVESKILRTNYNFRGVIVPKESKKVVFTNHLF